MAIPIKLTTAEKENYVSRPSVPSNKKESAEEHNSLLAAVKANYDRLLLRWATDISVNQALLAGQYILYIDGVLYRLTTSYSAGSPITWNAANAVRASSTHLRGAYNLSLTNDYPITGVGSAEDGSFVFGDEFYISVAGTLSVDGLGDDVPINVNAILKYISGDPTLPASWKVIQ